MSSNVDSSSSPSSVALVSWQTLFWTLIPLATNVMTQPSGRVLSLPVRSRTYIRSSPILCALNALSFILEIITTAFLHNVRLTRAADIVMKDRFYQKEEVLGEGEREDEAEEGEGIQGLEKMTWLRWLFFLLGTLGPAIKMCAMRGIPWTQGWGMMFLASFLVFEGISIVNWASRSKFSASKMAPGARALHEQVTFAYSDLPQRFRKMKKWLAAIGIFLHCSILVWAVMDIWTLRIPSSKIREILPDSLMLSVAFIWLTNLGILLASTFLLVMGWALFSAARNGSSIKVFIILLVGLLVIIGMAAGISILVWVLFDRHFLIDMLLSLVTLGATPAFMIGVEIVCEWSPKVGATLLVSEGENGGTDRYAVYCLAFFLANITVCVLWYSLRYDSDGTANPGWTGIFG